MNNTQLTAKGVRREAVGLMTDNWSRALAVTACSVFSLLLYLVLDQFVNGIIGAAMAEQSTGLMQLPNATLVDYYNYLSTLGIGYRSIVSLLIFVFFFLFLSPLNVGVANWYHSLAQYSNLHVGQVFYYYTSDANLIGALTLSVNIFLRKTLFLALFQLPAAGCFGFLISYAVRYNAVWGDSVFVLLTIATIAACLGGLILYFLFILRYFLAKYIFVSGFVKEVRICFKMSAKMMHGNIGKVFGIILSFVPLFISCLLLAPIVAVIPLYQATMAACAQDIIDNSDPDEYFDSLSYGR